MAGTFSNQFVKHLNVDVLQIDGYVALDSISNVVPTQPTATATVANSGPYTLLKGAQGAIGIATVVTQPHTSTGTYTFTLDGGVKATALLGVNVTLAGGVSDGYHGVLTPSVKANVLGTSTDSRTTLNPGTDPTVAPKTVIVSFHNSAGTLTDPSPHTGFWLSLTLRTTDVK